LAVLLPELPSLFKHVCKIIVERLRSKDRSIEDIFFQAIAEFAALGEDN
jgi:hypothetical protein